MIDLRIPPHFPPDFGVQPRFSSMKKGCVTVQAGCKRVYNAVPQRCRGVKFYTSVFLNMAMKEPYFGLTGGWLTFWITVRSTIGLTIDVNHNDSLGCLRD